MKTNIYTFSGTGTALSISDQVSDVIGNATVQLIPRLLKESADEITVDAASIGFVVPNYFGGIPNAVRTFIQRLNMRDVQYIFAIVPAGGGQGYSLKFIQKELNRKGKTLNYGRYAFAVSNYIAADYYDSMVKVGEKRKAVLDLLRENVRLYAEEIKMGKDFVQRSNPTVFAVNRTLSMLFAHKMIKDTSDGDKDYSISGKCTGCGTCVKVCQADNIVMEGGKPSFQHKCYRCMACIQYCPRNAILVNGKETSARKYTHPDYPATEMIRILHECSS